MPIIITLILIFISKIVKLLKSFCISFVNQVNTGGFLDGTLTSFLLLISKMDPPQYIMIFTALKKV